MISQLFYGGDIHNYVYQECVLKDIQSPRSLLCHRLTDRQKGPNRFSGSEFALFGEAAIRGF